MDIINTSLEALIQRATCNQNQCPDTAAIDAFCGLVNKEPECAQSATRFITAKVHSLQEWEALQALHVLDSCMKRCGSNFHAEVGKFRFLNELIKLVSPKYNGAHTPEPVKRRVLELMQSWTVYYPKEFKIKEAYDMLKKQGVVKEPLGPTSSDTHKTLDQNMALPPQIPVSHPPRNQDSIFQDSEKNRLLQKLLQSKNPDDLQAANRLIKTMVKEDERRVEMKSRHLSELEAAHNNARLLSEMLDSYSASDGSAASSDQDLELIKELQASCLRFRPNVQQLLSEIPPQDDRLFNEVLMANDELGEVLEKYNTVVVQGLPISAVGAGANLLDLSTPSEERLPAPPTDTLLCPQLSNISIDSPLPSGNEVPLQLLSSDIFPPPLTHQAVPPSHQPINNLASLGEIFSSLTQPPPSLQQTSTVTPAKPVSERKTGLEELDALSESLLKQSLPPVVPQPQVKGPAKLSMNQLALSQSPVHSTTSSHSNSTTRTASLLLSPSHPSSTNSSIPAVSSSSPTTGDVDPLDLLLGPTATTDPTQLNGDAPMVDITADSLLGLAPDVNEKKEEDIRDKSTVNIKTEPHRETPVENNVSKPLPLGDVSVPLESIKPGNLPPQVVLEEREICVTIHFGRDSPRPDVSVFVVTTTSKSQFPITDYLFQAIVPKGCRLRLQPPSSTELPAHNPFLPPAAITQVMLIASATKDPILLRVVVSFTMDDETITEMKEVEKFPLMNS